MRQISIRKKIDKYLDKSKKHWFFKYNNGHTFHVMRNKKKKWYSVRRLLYTYKYGVEKVLREQPACKVPLCVNPAHQTIRNYSRKLNKSQVKCIRQTVKEQKDLKKWYLKNKKTYEDIGKEYGISKQMVDYIARDHFWKKEFLEK